jgi:phospholipase/carboxylesterase
MTLLNPRAFNRREFCAIGGSAVASLALSSSCRHGATSQAARDGALTARPQHRVGTSATGQVTLGLDPERDAILQLPKAASKSPVPLLVLLHGATQSAEDMFWYLGSTPDETGVALLAPNSHDTTWDAISGSFGEDVEFINRALVRVFETTAIDPARVSIGGFSDGASYALALGLINGDLFSGVVAFSAGFVVDHTPHGKERRFFLSHGTRDHVLPIDRCGRRIAAALKARGYQVTFREFEGDHEIPPEIAREGLSFAANL